MTLLDACFDEERKVTTYKGSLIDILHYLFVEDLLTAEVAEAIYGSDDEHSMALVHDKVVKYLQHAGIDETHPPKNRIDKQRVIEFVRKFK